MSKTESPAPISTATLLLSAVVVATLTGVFGGFGLALAVFLLSIVGLIRSPTWHGQVVSAAVLAMLVIGLYLSSPRSFAGEAARQALCRNNLKQIAVALAGYREVHGHFPPAHTVDADGRPMHSWRVLLLPHLESESLFNRYNFDEPWDGANNQKLADLVLIEYGCPSEFGDDLEMTAYVVVTGPKTMWPTDEADRMPDVSEEPPNTILVVEIGDSDIHWMEPRDISFEEAMRGINASEKPCISSRHMRKCGFLYHDVAGVNVAFADGSTHFLPEDTPPEVLRSLLTVGSAKAVDLEKLIRPRFRWPRCFALCALVVSTVLLLVLPRRKKAVEYGATDK